MDTVDSNKGYGKVDDAQDLAFKRQSRKLFVFTCILLAVSVSIIVISVFAAAFHSQKNNSSNTTDPEVLFKLSLKMVVEELNSIIHLPLKLAQGTEDESIKSALAVCEMMFDEAMDRVNETLYAIDVGVEKNILNPAKIDDMQTWLSAAITDYDTCLVALDETDFTNSTISGQLKSAMNNSIQFTSNSLSIVARILSPGNPIHRRLLNSPNSFPNWVTPNMRQIFQVKHLKPNLTVAADGSGDVKTVNEAVARVPKQGTTMFLIYVKSGTYVENVYLDTSKWNVMIYGDGKDKTIISGSKNSHDGPKTFDTATLGVQGKGFMMKDIGIINTAGPEKEQAVAFRSGSDLSVYYRCSFDGFQDTLYLHSNRQFYRNCDVTGTVDFICGHATVVLQGCNIMPRQPLPNQYNTITAASNTNPYQTSGISIQRCTIFANGNVTAPTYLGRPWMEFATTVIMESVISPIVSPAGWIRWKPSVDPPASIYYGEYKNSGPGSDVTKRVKWTGYKPIMSDSEAKHFTVGSFIQGDDWLPATGVPYEST